MKIWLDDKKPAPSKDWWVATNLSEFADLILVIKSAELTIEAISFDYDLGRVTNGYDCIVWLSNNALEVWPVETHVHAEDLIGGDKIRKHDAFIRRRLQEMVG